VPEALARSDRDFLISDKMDEAPSRYLGAMRLILQRPVEVAGIALMAGACLAILVNALAMQNGTHATAFMRAQDGSSLVPLPPIAPEHGSADAAQNDALAVLRDVQLALAESGLYDGLADGVNGPKTTAAIRSFQQHNGLVVDGLSSPALLARIVAGSGPVLTPDASQPDPAPAQSVDQIAALINGNGPAPPSAGPQPDKRILGIEKALAKQGYGPLKVDGFMSNETRNAIARFEKDRSLPVTGQVTDRLIQALAHSGTKVE
jgi:peptidoglycan hydrolase-like protein with peptidoglycan-binding domain